MSDFKERMEQWSGYGALAIVTIAVIAGLFFKGVDGATLSDAVKDVGAALVPILTAYLAYRLVIREMPASERFLRAGEDALREVQRKFPSWLDGPRYNSAKKMEDDSDNTGKAGRYLFIRKQPDKVKAQFVPLAPLSEGRLEIHVKNQPLVLLNMAGPGEKGRQAEARETLKRVIHEAVEAVLKKPRWSGTYEEDSDVEDDVAILVDFDEAKLGPRKFRKVVVECLDAAWKAVERTARLS